MLFRSNSSVNTTFDTTLFLHYNDSTIFSKERWTIEHSLNSLVYKFDNETIKSTHFAGRFNATLMVGNKIFMLNNSEYHDFRDFAESPYISGFSDEGIDADANGKYDALQITADTAVMHDNYYSLILALYDLFGSIVEMKNETFFLSSGDNALDLNFNGSRIYSKKLNGPFVVKHIALYENHTLVDGINDAYITSYYDFNAFDIPDLPDVKVDISASDEYRYGINNASINISFKNLGSRHAFNIFTEIFDNNSLHLSNKSNIIDIGSEVFYQISVLNFSDFEIAAIADAQNFIDESDETNNVERLIIKLNHMPELSPIENITTNATKKITVNLSAYDIDGDNISFMINLSKFSNSNNLFEWNTTVNDSGYYLLAATSSDGFLNDSEVFEVTVLNISEPIISNDLDNDGIPDDIDKVIGNKSSINTSTFNFEVYINGSSNLSKYFNQTLKVKFLNKLTVLEFDFDFSKHILNLTNLTIDRQLPRAKGSLLVKGLNLYGLTKTAYIDRVDKRKSSVCIKDQEISSINEISIRCNRKDEYRVNCNLFNFFRRRIPYSCSYIRSSNKYMITGLNHSGIVQI